MDTQNRDSATCAVPTLHLSHCGRKPRYGYYLRGELIYQACRQHATGAGIARMILPRPWDFDQIVDLASGIYVKDVR